MVDQIAQCADIIVIAPTLPHNSGKSMNSVEFMKRHNDLIEGKLPQGYTHNLSIEGAKKNIVVEPTHFRKHPNDLAIYGFAKSVNPKTKKITWWQNSLSPHSGNWCDYAQGTKLVSNFELNGSASSYEDIMVDPIGCQLVGVPKQKKPVRFRYTLED
jgi:hypothetical protein